MLQLKFSSNAKKFIKKNQSSNPSLLKKLALAINELKNNPLPQGYKKLAGYETVHLTV